MPERDAALAVFDIDGVVADVRHRLRHLDRHPKNWAAFFAAADRDPVLPEGVELALRQAAEHILVWLTGRPEHLRPVTDAWLRRAGLPAELLFMRPVNDRRPAKDFKAGQLARLVRESSIAIVVDDDPEVVAKLRRLGHPVQLADWVPRSATLHTAQEREGRT
jgi:phosphoglycolate phosphatase-like HAD superfamily hydrolase